MSSFLIIPSFLIPYTLLRPKSLVLGAPSEGYASASVTAAKSLMRPVPSKRVRRGHKRPKNIKFISFPCIYWVSCGGQAAVNI